MTTCLAIAVLLLSIITFHPVRDWLENKETNWNVKEASIGLYAFLYVVLFLLILAGLLWEGPK